eukprot:TRINITY_DN4334_c0_g1_i6.p1 TRINITY_DN4334_c0_g1~~TRINITY_DN4334_c0_g1_i6.p1  ORF type:complete len:137 (+),score=17.52 TRINITY_DN4334_c0_g1_i6:347-757(+)
MKGAKFSEDGTGYGDILSSSPLSFSISSLSSIKHSRLGCSLSHVFTQIRTRDIERSRCFLTLSIPTFSPSSTISLSLSLYFISPSLLPAPNLSLALFFLSLHAMNEVQEVSSPSHAEILASSFGRTVASCSRCDSN